AFRMRSLPRDVRTSRLRRGSRFAGAPDSRSRKTRFDRIAAGIAAAAPGVRIRAGTVAAPSEPALAAFAPALAAAVPPAHGAPASRPPPASWWRGRRATGSQPTARRGRPRGSKLVRPSNCFPRGPWFSRIIRRTSSKPYVQTLACRRRIAPATLSSGSLRGCLDAGGSVSTRSRRPSACARTCEIPLAATETPTQAPPTPGVASRPRACYSVRRCPLGRHPFPEGTRGSWRARASRVVGPGSTRPHTTYITERSPSQHGCSERQACGGEERSPAEAQGLHVLRRAHRLARLQRHHPSAQVHQRARQDSAATHLR